MYRLSLPVLLRGATVALTYSLLSHPTAYGQDARSARAPSTLSSKQPASKAVLTMEGPGGKVALGDTLAAAKKAFPPPKGAQIMDAANYAIFQRPGWSWATEQPMEAFEVSLKQGKVVGILRTLVMPDQKVREKLIARTLQQAGKPTRSAVGKTAVIHAWDVKPNARFLVEMKQSLFGGGPTVMLLIGDQSELKLLNYRVDDVETMVKQMDMGAEAMKSRSKPGSSAKP